MTRLSLDYNYKLKAKDECWAFLHTMLTPQLQVLFNKNDKDHCAMLYKHWYAWLWFKKYIFIEVVKANKTTMIKICSFYLKDPES
jgi:hypothetical protein